MLPEGPISNSIGQNKSEGANINSTNTGTHSDNQGLLTEESSSNNESIAPPVGIDKKEQMKQLQLDLEMKLENALKVNTQLVDFGEVFPGQVLEESVVIGSNLKEFKIPFKIKINCLNAEYDDLDEYVFSMRRPNNNENYNYNDLFLIILAPEAMSYYKLAVKVPYCEAPTKINGNIEITSKEYPKTSLIIPIVCRVVFPSLKCEKMISIKSLNMSVLKLYLKNLKRQDFRITFKNLHSQAYIIEPSVIKCNSLDGLVDFSFFPNCLNTQPQVQSHIVMSMKTDFKDFTLKSKELNFVIIVKVKNSSLMYAFPMVVLMGDMSPGELS